MPTCALSWCISFCAIPSGGQDFPSHSSTSIWVQAAAEGRLREIFGCGTACIVQPVDGLVRADGQVLAAPFDASSITSMTARMTRALTDIQYAR